MKTFRRLRDICLLLTIVIYSGAHMPSTGGLARVGDSFKAGYDRAVKENAQQK